MNREQFFARLANERTNDLAEWHCMLVDRLADSDDGGRLDRLVHHPALGGPSLRSCRLGWPTGAASLTAPAG